MSQERAWIIGLPTDRPHQAIIADIRSAAGRSRKAEPGDRLDIARFEALATRLEQAALNDRHAPWAEVAVPGPLPEVLLFGQDSSAWSESLPADIRAAAQACVQHGRLPVLVIDPFAPARVRQPLTRKLGARHSDGCLTANAAAGQWRHGFVPRS